MARCWVSEASDADHLGISGLVLLAGLGWVVGAGRALVV